MKIALAFSGGKDSWACLWLNRHRLSNITVLWVNTGKNYPELLNTIEYAKSLCPNFVEIIVDRDGQNAFNGIPSDVVPINWTRYGQSVTTEKSMMIQSYLQCCLENIGVNLHKYCVNNGFTHLIRGQRNDEGHKSSARDESVVNGIIYQQPIENWNSQQVLDYIDDNMVRPEHFKLNHSSMDCYDCTAFTSESKDRIAYTEHKYPKLHALYAKRKRALKTALLESMKDYE